MGDLKVKKLDDADRSLFVSHLLKDIQALEYMIENRLFESGITRMGAEQEFCLVKMDYSPSNKALEILKEINDPHFTTELALYNLEINLDPVEVKGECFSTTQIQLQTLLAKARQVASRYDNKVILTGILPTIRKPELELSYLTPLDRYIRMNEIMKELRGGDFSLHLRGVDELTLLHDSILFEACNTSFQLHLQIDPDDMVDSYNWAQAISGPVLSVCVNSPLLMGRELWRETRIALFQQSVDVRKASNTTIDKEARVSFGTEWLRDSITNIFKDDIARHRMLLSGDFGEDSMKVLQQGGTPKLRALCLHNGTIYRWNRPCYGTTNGKPHLRIENRYLPSGPTITDEIANFAFWIGLMLGRPEKYNNLYDQMDFEETKENFFKAARYGKETFMMWFGKPVAAPELVVKELLPIAYKGLKKANVSESESNAWLRIIELRANRSTGARWTINSYRNLRKQLKRDDALKALTEVIGNRQLEEKPIHEWEEIQTPPATYPVYTGKKVFEIMSTHIYTVHPHDNVELVRKIMEWKNIHHMPVTNSSNHLVGILTSKNFSQEQPDDSQLIEVKDVMVKELYISTPYMEVEEAAQLMLKSKIGCLPVLLEDQLVGIITRNDIVTRHK